MNKKVAIVTLYANNNFGNKLQNYAVQEIVKRVSGYETQTVVNYYERFKLLKTIKDIIKRVTHYKNFEPLDIKREKKFKEFDKYIIKSKVTSSYRFSNKKLERLFDYFVVGSDQVWNQTTGHISELFLLNFVKDSSKKISFAASLGTDNLLDESKNQIKLFIKDFNSISVRENSAKEIIEKITNRKDVEVLLDPTMILTTDDWDNVSKKPKQMVIGNEKYILLYFLGNLSEDRKKNIFDFANKNNCRIINILDKNDEFYNCGPSEFIWLEKHAYMVCTDSFHSSVFAILYKRPFIVFNRDDGQNGVNEMNSRIDTLLSKFGLEENYYAGIIDIGILNKNYDYIDNILYSERNKAIEFLEQSFDIQEKEINS
ncbi:MAG: polysaccharide pyruvyl transferase family protein [Bacilli bacterium]|nr:polysaccharide pyruvyl transferase family protein [Bacilli bacterium]